MKFVQRALRVVTHRQTIAAAATLAWLTVLCLLAASGWSDSTAMRLLPIDAANHCCIAAPIQPSAPPTAVTGSR